MSATLVIGGWVPRAPERGETKSGRTKTTFSVKAFGKKDEPIWVKVMILGDHLDGVVPFIRPGTRVIVSGRLAQPRAYMGRDQTPNVQILVFAESITLVPGEGRQDGATQAEGSQPVAQQLALKDAPETVDFSDDLPF